MALHLQIYRPLLYSNTTVNPHDVFYCEMKSQWYCIKFNKYKTLHFAIARYRHPIIPKLEIFESAERCAYETFYFCAVEVSTTAWMCFLQNATTLTCHVIAILKSPNNAVEKRSCKLFAQLFPRPANNSTRRWLYVGWCRSTAVTWQCVKYHITKGYLN